MAEIVERPPASIFRLSQTKPRGDRAETALHQTASMVPSLSNRSLRSTAQSPGRPQRSVPLLPVERGGYRWPMVRILDYTGTPQERSTTVAAIGGLRTDGRQLTQTTAGTAEEAAAAEAAGIEMIACLGQAVPDVRQGTSSVFVSAAIDFQGAVSPDDLLQQVRTELDHG